jgi:hypothetical protein
MLNFERYTGDGKISIDDVKKRKGESWQNVEEVYANESGQWVVVWRRTPPIPNVSDIDNLEFAKVAGAGRGSGSGSSVTLSITANDYTGAPADVNWVILESRSIIVPVPTSINFSYYMSQNLHYPFMWLATYRGLSAQNNPNIGGASFTDEKSLCEWTIPAMPDGGRLYLGMSNDGTGTSPQTVYSYLSGLQVGGKLMAWM